MTHRKVKNMVIVFVLVAACAAVLTGTVLTVETKPIAAKRVSEMLFKPGDITGVIMDSSGKGLAHVDVTARNVRDDIVRTTKTDNKGAYTLPKMEKGKYTIHVDGMKASTLRVTDTSTYSSLTILTPGSGRGSNQNSGTTSRDPNNSRFTWNSIQLPNSYVSVGGPVGPQDPTDPEPWDENVSP